MKGVKVGGAGDGKGKLCLEDYMDFCDDPHLPDLIIEQLNHIIFMHGFIRLHRRHKAEIMSTLDSMELMQAARSTLDESISRCDPLGVEEVCRDFAAIGWQECPLGSVRSLGPPRREEAGVTVASPVAAIYCSGTATPALASRGEGQRKPKKVRKRKRARAASLPLLTMGPTGEASR